MYICIYIYIYIYRCKWKFRRQSCTAVTKSEEGVYITVGEKKERLVDFYDITQVCIYIYVYICIYYLGSICIYIFECIFTYTHTYTYTLIYVHINRFKTAISKNLKNQLEFQNTKNEENRLSKLVQAANIVGFAYKSYFLRKMRRLMAVFRKVCIYVYEDMYVCLYM
jgi:hypothetical protein